MNNSGLKIIGSKTHNGQSAVFWSLEELDNAFHFFIKSAPDAEPLLLEYDELTAASPAYLEQGPLSMLDVLNMLEKLWPGFAGIEISADVKLIRQRWERSPGLSLQANGKMVSFMKEATLDTMNFLDFHKDAL